MVALISVRNSSAVTPKPQLSLPTGPTNRSATSAAAASIIVSIATLNVFYGLLIFFTAGKYIYSLPDWFATGIFWFEFDWGKDSSYGVNLQIFGAAWQQLSRAIELDPRSPDALNLAGVLFEMQKDYERARKLYGKAIKYGPYHEPAQQNMRRMFELFSFGSSNEPFNLGE